MKKRDVIEHFGTVKSTARYLGISNKAVYAWPDAVPLGTAYRLQALTGGKLKVQESLYPNKRAATSP
jgi:hypothetical protein